MSDTTDIPALGARNAWLDATYAGLADGESSGDETLVAGRVRAIRA